MVQCGARSRSCVCALCRATLFNCTQTLWYSSHVHHSSWLPTLVSRAAAVQGREGGAGWRLRCHGSGGRRDEHVPWQSAARLPGCGGVRLRCVVCGCGVAPPPKAPVQKPHLLHSTAVAAACRAQLAGGAPGRDAAPGRPVLPAQAPRPHLERAQQGRQRHSVRRRRPRGHCLALQLGRSNRGIWECSYIALPSSDN